MMTAVKEKIMFSSFTPSFSFSFNYFTCGQKGGKVYQFTADFQASKERELQSKGNLKTKFNT